MALQNFRVDDFSTYQMVLNRLPFLADTPANAELVGGFIYEAMIQLESCFKVDEQEPVPVPPATNVGDESKYTVFQRMILADLVSALIIAIKLMANTAGTASGGVDGNISTPKYMSRTKAGSVEVEWKMLSLKEGVGFFSDGETMYKRYKSSATSRALSIGCLIDVLDVGAYMLYQDLYGQRQPFVVVSEDSRCGFPFHIPEQG